jgi:hypothetical protein
MSTYIIIDFAHSSQNLTVRGSNGAVSPETAYSVVEDNALSPVLNLFMLIQNKTPLYVLHCLIKFKVEFPLDWNSNLNQAGLSKVQTQSNNLLLLPR